MMKHTKIYNFWCAENQKDFPAKEVMLAICAIFLVMLSSGCAPQEVPIDNVPEPIVEEAPQEDQPVEEIKEELIIKEYTVVEEKDDLAFDLPPDEDDSAGWTQTLGPLGG